jgi:hypothetical protein
MRCCLYCEVFALLYTLYHHIYIYIYISVICKAWGLHTWSNCIALCHVVLCFFFQLFLQPVQCPGLFFNSVIIFTQKVGLLGRVKSPWQGRYLYTGQHKQNKRIHRHQCLEWDSNPRSQCSNERKQFMP